MTKLTLNVPATIKVRLGRDTGDFLNVETALIPANVWEAFMAVAVKTILINAYNGGGKDATQAQKVAAAQKKLDAWKRGELNVVTRGDSMLSAMREAYVDDIREKTGATVKQVEDSIKSTVHAVFGEKESATFGRFIDAIATLIAKENGTEMEDERAAFEAKYEALAEQAAAKRAKASEKLDVTSLTLAAFKKAK